MALHAGGRDEQAYAVLRKSLNLDSADPETVKLGIEISRRLGKDDEAANYCARLLRLDSNHRDARLHLAQLQAAAGDFDVAEVNFQRVLELHSDDAVAAFSLGCLALRDENLTDGWAGYARRFEAGLSRPQHDLRLPPLQQIWDEADELAKARIAIRSEPSLKDQILFARWLTALRQDANFITAELDPRLIPLIDQTTRRISTCPAGSLQDDDATDLNLSAQVQLGDLGAKYGTDISRLGDGVPYLQFEREKSATLRQAYCSVVREHLLIGLCWRGGDMAIPLIDWLPILQLDRVGFVSLQPGPALQELHEVFDSLGRSAIRDPSIDPQTNLRGFAAQIAAVDIVISIDEVPAHLAGALGVPVICLLPEVAEWRWFQADRLDSPWYPTMQLYRQTTRGKWSDVMERIAADLKTRIAQAGQGGAA
jgi:tetratricopeptide (TPR) repeat protein